MPNTAKRSSFPLVVISNATGNLYRVFPSGLGVEIDDEGDLRNLAGIDRLSERDARPIPASEGHDFDLVAFPVCPDCEGSGRERTRFKPGGAA